MKRYILALALLVSATNALASVHGPWTYPANASSDDVWNAYTARSNNFIYNKVRRFAGRHRGFTITNVEHYGGPWQRIKAISFTTGDGLKCTRILIKATCENGVGDYDVSGMPMNPATGGPGY